MQKSGDLAKTTVHTEDLKKGDYFYKTTVCTEVWENVYDLATVRYTNWLIFKIFRTYGSFCNVSYVHNVCALRFGVTSLNFCVRKFKKNVVFNKFYRTYGSFVKWK